MNKANFGIKTRIGRKTPFLYLDFSGKMERIFDEMEDFGVERKFDRGEESVV